MAGRTFFRSRPVKQYRFAADHLNVLVTGFAAHILMRSLQRKSGTALMVEKRGLPFKAVVAVGAGRNFASVGKLRAVDVLMAFFALGRRRFEVGLHQPGSQIRRLVAIDTCRAAMRS